MATAVALNGSGTTSGRSWVMLPEMVGPEAGGF